MSLSKKCLGLLQLELEDLKEDCQQLLTVYKKRETDGDITHYTLMENTVLLRNEIQGFNHLAEALENFPKDRYSDCRELFPAVIDFIAREVKDFDYPDSIVTLVKRKIEKIKIYMENKVD
jgi:hypothetical protein